MQVGMARGCRQRYLRGRLRKRRGRGKEVSISMRERKRLKVGKKRGGLNLRREDNNISFIIIQNPQMLSPWLDYPFKED